VNSIPFLKASACGNDFLLIELANAPAGLDPAELTRRICDRRNGIGADGVEWISLDPEGDARVLLFNADGSAAEISGNGTRCVAAYLVSQLKKDCVMVRTGAGLRTCTLIARVGNRFDFDITMGQPQIGDPLSIRIAATTVTGTPVSLGNPHFVRFVDEIQAGWQVEAGAITTHRDFKDGVNVELVRCVSNHAIETVFFERGAGETQSSGTGSCAAAVAAIAAGKAQSPVEVRAPGGTQVVRWEGEVFLRGPAQLIGLGEFWT
jgi:diaminopimelate epimerase